MRLSLLALGGTALFSSLSSAIDLNPDDPQSIKDAAKTISKDLLTFYTGYRPGDTPGNLPAPYYWWEAGAMFNTLIDYWYYTGDDQYNAITMQAMQHQIGDHDDYMPTNQTKTLGNDDQSFWGMAAMRAAETKFENPPNGQPQWLALAQAVFNEQTTRWNTEICGGGLKWQIFWFNNGYDYRNSISTGCFFNLASRLYRYTGNTTYSDWAEKAWDWLNTAGLMNPQFAVIDGVDEQPNCKNFHTQQWTYTNGIIMQGAANMWNVTSNQTWKDRVNGLIGAAGIFYQNNVMYELCEPGMHCNNDQMSFKAYLSWSMATTQQLASFTVPQLSTRISTSAVAAAKQCNAGNDQTLCGIQWTNNGANDGAFGPGQQMTALEIVLTLLAPNAPAPVTASTGGISKGDPNAGSQGVTDPTAMNPVTTGDKAGAAIATIAVAVAILGGAYFMIAP